MDVSYVGALAVWMPGPLELAVILFVALLLFGRRLPQIARGAGKSLVEFKKGLKDVTDVKADLTRDVTRPLDD